MVSILQRDFGNNCCGGAMKEIISKIINEVLEKRGNAVKIIILFGSRERSDFKRNSGWNLMVVINKNLSFFEKRKIIAEMQRRLAKHKMPNDIILKSEQQFDTMKNYVDCISYYASKEGLQV